MGAIKAMINQIGEDVDIYTLSRNEIDSTYGATEDSFTLSTTVKGVFNFAPTFKLEDANIIIKSTETKLYLPSDVSINKGDKIVRKSNGQEYIVKEIMINAINTEGYILAILVGNNVDV